MKHRRKRCKKDGTEENVQRRRPYTQCPLLRLQCLDGCDQNIHQPHCVEALAFLHVPQSFNLSQKLPHPRQVDVFTTLALDGSMEATDQLVELALLETQTQAY